MIKLVRPLLEKYEVDVYICGHDHDRQLLEPVNGAYYIVSGTGSLQCSQRFTKASITQPNCCAPMQLGGYSPSGELSGWLGKIA